MSVINSYILACKSLFIVTRRRSYIGLPKKYKDACVALGLKKLHHSHLLPPNPRTIGNLALLRNLITIKLVQGGPFPQSVLENWLNGRGVKKDPGFFIESKSGLADI